MAVALLGHPSSALKVGVESPPRPTRYAAWVKMQDDAGNFPPIGPISVGIKETHVGDQVFVVIRRQDPVRRRGIGNVWVERRSLGAPGRVDVGHNNKPRFFVSLPLIAGYCFGEDASERMRKCQTLFGWLLPVL
jgi:hypothetical protein